MPKYRRSDDSLWNYINHIINRDPKLWKPVSGIRYIYIYSEINLNDNTCFSYDD